MSCRDNTPCPHLGLHQETHAAALDRPHRPVFSGDRRGLKALRTTGFLSSPPVHRFPLDGGPPPSSTGLSAGWTLFATFFSWRVSGPLLFFFFVTVVKGAQESRARRLALSLTCSRAFFFPAGRVGRFCLPRTSLAAIVYCSFPLPTPLSLISGWFRVTPHGFCL